MYCTVDDLRSGIKTIRLIEATDDAHPNKGGEVNMPIIEDLIALACGVIDGYIAGRVTLPLVTVPLIIRKIAVDLSIYNVHERVGQAAKDSPVERRRDYALALLRDIQNGKLSLGVSPVDATPIAPTSSGAMVRTGGPAFTMESMASLGGMP